MKTCIKFKTENEIYNYITNNNWYEHNYTLVYSISFNYCGKFVLRLFIIINRGLNWWVDIHVLCSVTVSGFCSDNMLIQSPDC